MIPRNIVGRTADSIGILEWSPRCENRYRQFWIGSVTLGLLKAVSSSYKRIYGLSHDFLLKQRFPTQICRITFSQVGRMLRAPKFPKLYVEVFLHYSCSHTSGHTSGNPHLTSLFSTGKVVRCILSFSLFLLNLSFFFSSRLLRSTGISFVNSILRALYV